MSTSNIRMAQQCKINDNDSHPKTPSFDVTSRNYSLNNFGTAYIAAKIYPTQLVIHLIGN